MVEGEQRGRSANFGTHVTNGGHSSSRERLETWGLVFDDSSSSTLDGKNTSDLEDGICAEYMNKPMDII